MFKNNKIFNLLFASVLFLGLGSLSQTVCLANDSVFMALNISEIEEEEEEQSTRYTQKSDEKIKHLGAGGNGSGERSIHIIQEKRVCFFDFLSFQFVSTQAFFAINAYNNRLLNSLHFPKLYSLYQCSKVFLS